MKKILFALLLLCANNVYAVDKVVVVPIGGDEVSHLVFEAKDVLSFHQTTGTTADYTIYTVPEGKTFVLKTIHAQLTGSSLQVKNGTVIVLRHEVPNGYLVNFESGIAFGAGSVMKINSSTSNAYTLSGYLYSTPTE